MKVEDELEALRMTWDEIKQQGSTHYKTGDVEPIDLYKSAGVLRDVALGAIIKYAFRNIVNRESPVSNKDMDKIIHYAEMVKTVYGT